MRYLKHKDHGIHIVYNEAELEACKKNGWVVATDYPPKSVADEPEQAVEKPVKKRRRKK